MDSNVSKYQAFIKTVEYGSFSKAAEILNYSQSSISKMIRDLESEWNITLLERSHTGVILTSDGKQILPFAKRLCEEYKNLQMKIDDIRGVQTGLIRIGTISSVANHWLPNMIKAFQKDYPGVDYELLLGDYTEIEEWIAEGRVDCGFLRMPKKEGFEIIPLGQDRLMAVLPPDDPLAALEKVPLASLCRGNFMLLEKGAKAEISELFEAHGLTPRVRFTTWDDYAIMSMVESGLGISILPELILKGCSYRIAARELDVPSLRTLVVALRSKNNASLAVKRFLEYLDKRDFAG